MKIPVNIIPPSWGYGYKHDAPAKRSYGKIQEFNAHGTVPCRSEKNMPAF